MSELRAGAALDATIGTAADFQNSYTYDSFGNETSVTQQGATGGDAVAAENVTFSYDTDGRLSTINRYASTGTTNAVASSAYGYDDDGNLTSLTDTSGAGATLAGYTWTYNAGGLVQTFANSQHTDEDLAYSYDADNELTGASGPSDGESYTYDANGNRTNTDGTADTAGADNEPGTEAGATYTEDADGNVTGVLNPDGSHATYVWDNRNRLVEADVYNTSGTETVVRYTYDVFNNLIGRSVTQDGTTTNQSFVFDDPAENGQMVLAFASTGSAPTTAQLTDRFLWGAAVDQILADENGITANGAGAVDWTLADNQGTVRDWIDSSAAVTEHITYDAFGQQTGAAGPFAGAPAHDVVFGYTGKFYDTATGLQWNVNRWYNPATGTWMSQDPIGFLGGQSNLSDYLGGDPENAVDPLGTDAVITPGSGKHGHQGIRVEIPGPDGKPSGILTADFSAVGDPGYWALFTGTPGQIVIGVSSPDLGLGPGERFKGCQAQDMAIISWILDQAGQYGISEGTFRSQRPYNLLFFNCRVFAREAANSGQPPVVPPNPLLYPSFP